jgi:hypothetical protein
MKLQFESRARSNKLVWPIFPPESGERKKSVSGGCTRWSRHGGASTEGIAAGKLIHAVLKHLNGEVSSGLFSI